METPVTELRFDDDGKIPNHPRWPLLHYSGPFSGLSSEQVVARFEGNGWGACWVNGVFDFHHYHAEAHEVLGCVSGWADVQFGGEAGEIVRFEEGDVVVIPAGVGHKRVSGSSDFTVVGAYPPEQAPDMQHGNATDERPHVLAAIQAVPKPDIDPVMGEKGPLLEAWAD